MSGNGSDLNYIKNEGVVVLNISEYEDDEISENERDFHRLPEDLQNEISKTMGNSRFRDLGFLRIPRIIVEDVELTANSKLLFGALMGHCREGGGYQVFASQRTLADELGITKGTVQNSLKQLKELGFISWKIGKYGANHYKFEPMPSYLSEGKNENKQMNNGYGSINENIQNKVMITAYFGEKKSES